MNMNSFVATIGEFLKMNTNKEANFDQNRIGFIIPKYQREYSWVKERVQTLITDIKIRDKFLGNIIVNKVKDYYEIVDGQQRITTTILILIALFNKSKNGSKSLAEEQKTLLDYIFKKDNPILKNESIGNYMLLHENEIVIQIDQDSDIYFQKETFYDLYENIEQELCKLNCEELLSFQKKVLDCQVLVLIGEPDGKLQDSIEEVFLDINYKSQVLDVADIFKGYCFKNYDSNSHEKLKSQWADIRWCTKQFEYLFGYNKNPRENTCEYLYLYLLSVPNSYGIPANLSIANKHYLEGKGHSKTKDLLDDMIAYGKHVINFDKRIKTIDYVFEDICLDAIAHKNDTGRIESLRAMALNILESKEAQYYKLPFFMLLHFLQKDDALRSKLDFTSFKSLVTNMYIYAFLFTNSGKSKNKTLIAYNVLDKIHINDSNTIKDVLAELKTVRREFLDSFELFRNFNVVKCYAIYSIMDHYTANDNFIEHIYSLKNGYTPEHFLIHNNKLMEVKWKDSLNNFSFSLRELLGRPDGKNYKATLYKKQTTNYLILPKELNEFIEHDDIVSKIDAIKDYYLKHQASLPAHIDLFVKHIEGMTTFIKLADLKGKNENQKGIENAYKEFINEYFSDENQACLYRNLETRFKSSFYNH